MSERLADDHSNNPLGGDVAESYISSTSTLRPAAGTYQPPASALTARRQSASSLAPVAAGARPPIARPTPRSGLISSPTRPSRPGSPPSTRYPSPPMRAQSFMSGAAGARSNSPHAQQDQPAPPASELASFAELCRQLYYAKDASAAQSIDTILNRLPPSSRTIYARTMASVRSQWHREEELKRRELVERTLEGVEPGAKVKAVLGVKEGGTIAMRSKRAKQARAEGLKAVLEEHCQQAMPGVHPFFRSLHYNLVLQSLKANKGGAGKRRVEWEVDMAVFSEASGGSWMVDSIELLKGLLGCSERIKEAAPESYFDEEDEDDGSVTVSPPSGEAPAAPLDAGASQPLVNNAEEPQVPLKKSPPAVPPHRSIGKTSLRDRAGSDPFLDPSDRRTPVAKGPLSDPPSPVLPSPSSETPFFDSAVAESTRPAPNPRRLSQATISLPAPPPPQFRIFTLPPYLTDPELTQLARLFPDFIRARSMPTSPTAAPTKMDEEAALGRAEGGAGEVSIGKAGHGEVRIGATSRDAGWTGTMWEEFICWLMGLFGL